MKSTKPKLEWTRWGNVAFMIALAVWLVVAVDGAWLGVLGLWLLGGLGNWLSKHKAETRLLGE